MAYDASKSSLGSLVKKYGDIQGRGRMILIYGPFGCGKTHLAGTAENSFFLDSDIGENTQLRKMQIPYVTVYTKGAYKRIIEVITHAKNKTDIFDVGGPAENVKTIVLDSWTKLNEQILNEACIENNVDLTKGKPTFTEYMMLQNRQVEIINLMKVVMSERGINFIATALEVLQGDEAEELKREANSNKAYSKIEGSPDLVGKFRKRIGAEFDEVYYLEIVQAATPFRKVWTVQHNSYLAKTRLGLPASIDNPTIPSIFKMMDAAK